MRGANGMSLKKENLMRLVSSLVTVGAIFLSTSLASAQAIDWQKIDEALGRKPALAGDVHRYGFPRTDLNVTLDGVTIKPAFLSCWNLRSTL
jgi:hypothetical protein